MGTKQLSLIVLFIMLGFAANAQRFYGSACVKVTNSDGKSRYITVVMNKFDDCSTSTCAKSKLLNLLNSQKNYNEELTSNVYYDITDNDTESVSGDASVLVRSNSGKERVITVTTNPYSTETRIISRKAELLQLLDSRKNYDEVFAECINFNLTTK